MTGRGKGGSWAIRGDQLGRAIGATIDPSPESVKGYDAAIIVKRPRADLVKRLHDARVPIVWDIVDSYPQPAGNDWDKATCIDWLQREVEWIKPAAILAATKVMRDDCAQFAVPVLALPHHARPEQRMNPLRETVKVVGYQGGEQYLGHWLPAITRECSARGWMFHMDQSKTADVSLANWDIVVAMREQSGYAARNWKSNVKLANAQGSGTPIICNREAGYLGACGVRYADDENEMAMAFDALTSYEARKRSSTVMLQNAPTLDLVAKNYRAWLERL